MIDYIIAGAGPAGCVLAHRLSDDPAVKVLLIEAGGSDRHPYFSMPAGFARMTKGISSWGWSTVPQAHMRDRVFWYTQAKVIGGGSSINAQLYTRGHPADYDEWATDEHCAGWSFADVLPYFKRAEHNQRLHDVWHGSGGPLFVSDPVNPIPIDHAFLRAGQEAGLPFNPDFNGASQAGVGFYQLTIKDAQRSSAATAYLKPILSRPNLTVRTGAEAIRILVERGRAVGVELRVGNARERVHCAREVLVTSGAIGSPRLLMLSGIGPADELRAAGITPVHDLPGVGRNLQDHLDLYVICECSGDYTYDRYARPHRMVWAGLRYFLFKQGPVASQLFEAGGFAYADDKARSPDIQFHLGLGSGIEAGVIKLRNPGVTLNSAFLRPRSRGSVKLRSSNPDDHPLLDPNYWADPYDRAMSLGGLRLAREIMRQKALAPFLLAERLPGPDSLTDDDLAAFACKHAKTDHHPVGTCKMGIDTESVVRPDTLKVIGMEGLRVCDSSIMPRINSSNTNAPTVMIGEKASDLVRGLTPLPAANVPPRAQDQYRARSETT